MVEAGKLGEVRLLVAVHVDVVEAAPLLVAEVLQVAGTEVLVVLSVVECLLRVALCLLASLGVLLGLPQSLVREVCERGRGAGELGRDAGRLSGVAGVWVHLVVLVVKVA